VAESLSLGKIKEENVGKDPAPHKNSPCINIDLLPVIF
jgi:hypothetical protein